MNNLTNQVSFGRNRSTIDHIFAVGKPVTGEKPRVSIRHFYFFFIDFKKAFDSVEHRAVRETMKKQGVQKDMRELISAIYKSFENKIKPVLKFKKELSRVIQSPLIYLFNAVLLSPSIESNNQTIKNVTNL